jgi:3-hydroxybutyryl-CoA dehydrogenase
LGTFKTIGVIGSGVMGAGIVQTCIQSGYDTIMSGRNTESIYRATSNIKAGLSKMVERGKMSQAESEQALARIDPVVGFDSLGKCDIVIEAVVEDLEVKKDLFRKLDKLCPAKTILASDTATLPIIEIAKATNRPEKVLGLHILIPAPLSKMVEMVRSEVSSEETLGKAKEFCESLGKIVVTCADSPGFIINRLLAPYLLEAVRLVEQNVASKEDIDACMQLGTGYPMGPLRLLDNVGLDQFHDLASSLCTLLKDKKFEPPALLTQMVTDGRLGRKSGHGFYDWK